MAGTQCASALSETWLKNTGVNDSGLPEFDSWPHKTVVFFTMAPGVIHAAFFRIDVASTIFMLPAELVIPGPPVSEKLSRCLS